MFSLTETHNALITGLDLAERPLVRGFGTINHDNLLERLRIVSASVFTKAIGTWNTVKIPTRQHRNKTKLSNDMFISVLMPLLVKLTSEVVLNRHG